MSRVCSAEGLRLVFLHIDMDHHAIASGSAWTGWHLSAALPRAVGLAEPHLGRQLDVDLDEKSPPGSARLEAVVTLYLTTFHEGLERADRRSRIEPLVRGPGVHQVPYARAQEASPAEKSTYPATPMDKRPSIRSSPLA